LTFIFKNYHLLFSINTFPLLPKEYEPIYSARDSINGHQYTPGEGEIERQAIRRPAPDDDDP
jgi:hypothetical protein